MGGSVAGGGGGGGTHSALTGGSINPIGIAATGIPGLAFLGANAVANTLSPLFAAPGAPGAITPQGDNATSVTPGQRTDKASTSATQNQLMNEKHAFASAPTLTSGAGLLDEPTTTSRVLMGN